MLAFFVTAFRAILLNLEEILAITGDNVPCWLLSAHPRSGCRFFTIKCLTYFWLAVIWAPARR